MVGGVTARVARPNPARAAWRQIMSEQKNDEFIEPSPEEIVLFTKEHVSQLEQTDGDDVWVVGGMNHVLVHTVGRKSGRIHKVALPFWTDENGHRVVVA